MSTQFDVKEILNFESDDEVDSSSDAGTLQPNNTSDGEKDKEEDEVVEDKVEGQGVNNNSEVEADRSGIIEELQQQRLPGKRTQRYFVGNGAYATPDGDAPCKVCGLHHGGDPYNCPNDLCKICLKPGHMSWDCTEIIPKSRKPLSSLAVCYRCGKNGHEAKDCSAASPNMRSVTCMVL
mmetsp:Transcript_135/g.190  ORF Transcript_135/g.190 Transcript_135/m.190 type:complete len:179 (+) Transcript_135:94-630(+)